MATTEQAIATPVKLSNGDWGAKAPDTVKAGDTVTIKTRAGKTWEAVIASIFTTGEKDAGEGFVLCATKAPGGKAKPRRASQQRSYGGRRTGCQCGSVEGRIKDSDCWTCKHDAF
jgi:hypothetical protein